MIKDLRLLKKAALISLALFFLLAGANHFLNPELYLAMMPPLLPWPDTVHKIAGVAEILGGLGLLIRPVRPFAAWGLVLLLVAVFPANIHAALRGEIPGLPVSPWVLWARLPFQAAFLFWTWWVGVSSWGGDLNTKRIPYKTQW